jgi:integrase
MSPRRQAGSLYVNGDTCYLKYRTVESKDGTRVHRTVRLCEKSDKFTWWKKNGKLVFGSAVKELRDEKMLALMQEMRKEHSTSPTEDMRVVDFWEQKYLPYCEQIIGVTGKARKKPSTIRGYKQIWKQHLAPHFADLTLRDYTPSIGKKFLRSLSAKGTMVRTTLKHVKGLASSIFQHAVDEDLIPVNIWRDVKIPDDAARAKTTKHYTLAEAEDIISALVEDVDCQLVMALSCFLGLRPGEIAALKWEDFDSESVHIRRSVVRGIVDILKTPESVATLPLIDQVRVPLELWRLKSGKSEGYVFESRNGTPVDLHNLIARKIVPALETKESKEKGLVWKGLYAGRRGAATAAVEATGGNYAVAQALLRHKSMTTTLNVYKKQITPDAFKAGMKLLEAAANGTK